jgi:acetylornithine deacetylase/succinyl-diaminopimelate desuccinylase-like protein
VIDAISALARILGRLHDDDGQVAIEGLIHGPWEGLQLTEEEYREDMPLRPSVSLVGSGTIAERLWSKPAVAVLGLDAPRVVEASNQLVPVASAKVSLRIAPEEDAQLAMDLLTGHLADQAPWGVEVDVAPGTSGQGMRVKTDGPGFAAMNRAMQAAFGREVVHSGSGGSVPLVPELSAALPEAEILLYGASDERSQYHSIDESVDLGELERVTLAEALLLLELARS